MVRATSVINPRFPLLGKFTHHLTIMGLRGIGHLTKSYSYGGSYSQAKLNSLREKILTGETVLLLGVTPGGHNTGVALVEASLESGIKLLGNHEEERFRAEKHCMKFPVESLRVVQQQLQTMGKTFEDVHAILLGWDYCVWAGYALDCLVSEFPGSLTLLKRDANPQMHLDAAILAIGAPAKIPRALGLSDRMPVIHSRHHDNHAWFSYITSPLARSGDPVLIVVVDGAGDDGAISI